MVKKQGRIISIKTLDRSKKWAVVDKGKIISKHVDFYLAQTAVTRHFQNRKITNSYKLIPLNEIKPKSFFKKKKFFK